jgi:hypothetical protein
VFWRDGTGDPFAVVGSACAIALHEHQPVIPGGEDLRSARRIGNLQYVEEHPDVGDNHNAPVFRWCDPDYRWAVEWLGCPLGILRRPVDADSGLSPARPAWQRQFVGLFGLPALGREEDTVEQPDGSGVERSTSLTGWPVRVRAARRRALSRSSGRGDATRSWSHGCSPSARRARFGRWELEGQDGAAAGGADGRWGERRV